MHGSEGGRGHEKPFGPVGPEGLDEAESGRAREKAARMVGVGTTNLYRAEYVAKHDPDMYKQVESGEVKASAAVNIIKARAAPKPTRTQPAQVRADQIRDLASKGHRAAQDRGSWRGPMAAHITVRKKVSAPPTPYRPPSPTSAFPAGRHPKCADLRRFATDAKRLHGAYMDQR